MSDEEIKKALEIIKNKAINIEIVNDIVDKKEYIGFDKDNFEILEQCYYNCQYFARNLEQLMINLKDKDKEIERLNNIINELKEWFKGYHKSYASCKWYEGDYIEFIEHLENELKGSDSNE